MKKFFSKIFSYGHELGAIYYAWSLIASLSGIGYGAYKQLADQQTAQAFFYIFLGMAVVAVITVPLLALAVIKRGGKKDVANPNLRLESRAAVYEISRTKSVKKQTLELHALDIVEHYQFSLVTTGETVANVRLVNTGVGSLVGPIPRRNADVYHVTFPEPLKKGAIVRVELEISLDDPNRTMKPYACDTFISCCSYGSFTAEYNFKPMPKAVHSEVVLSQGGSALAPVQLLHPKGGKYHVVAQKVIPNAAYSVSWIW